MGPSHAVLTSMVPLQCLGSFFDSSASWHWASTLIIAVCSATGSAVQTIYIPLVTLALLPLYATLVTELRIAAASKS
jgi:hypothetical protein